MKIIVNDAECVEVDENFVGLAVDEEGCICYFSRTHVTWFEDGWTCLKEEALSREGPFTKFNGSVTLEND